MPLSVHGCDKAISEFFAGEVLRQFSTWTPFSEFPFDAFAGISQATITRCMPDSGWQHAERLVINNNATSFQPQPTNTISFITPGSVSQLSPGAEKRGTSGTVFGAFTTDFNDAFTPDTVAMARSDFPGSRPVTNTPHVVAGVPVDPNLFGTFLGGQTHAAVFNFSGGTCPPEQWSGTFETLHTLDPDGDGLIDVDWDSARRDGIDTALIQYSSNQVSFGTTKVDPYQFILDGSGVDYSENYQYQNADVNSGTYGHTFGSESTCFWDFVLGGGLTEMVEEVAAELDAVAAAAIAVAATTSSPPTTPAPTTQAPASTPTGAGGTPGTAATTSAPASGDGSGGGGGLILIIIGLILLAAAAAYWWRKMFLTPPPWEWPCWPEYVAWQQAKKACEEATKKAKEKRKKAKEAKQKRKDAEKKKKDHCKKYPPACGKQATASSGGRTINRDDVWIQRQWARDAWSNYTPGDADSARATEDQWKQPPSEDFRKKKQAELDAARAAVAGLDADVAKAKADEAAAEAEAVAAETAAEKACAAAAKAKAAFDACIGAGGAAGGQPGAGGGAQPGGAGPGGTPPPGPGGTPTGGGGGAGDPAKKSCAAEKATYDAAQKACDKAQGAADNAQEAADDAEESADESREDLEDYCHEWPPNCYEGSAEDPNRAGSRITEKDVFAQQMWAEQVWVDYKTDQIDVDEVQQRWQDGPPQSFIDDQKQKLEDAKVLKPGLDAAVKQAEEAAAAAAKKAAEAQKAATEACSKADQARKAFEDCVKAAGA